MTRPIVEHEIQHLDHDPMCSNQYHEPRRADVFVKIHDCNDWLWCGACWTVWRDVLQHAFATGKLADGVTPFNSCCLTCNVTFTTFDAWCQAVQL